MFDGKIGTIPDEIKNHLLCSINNKTSKIEVYERRY